MARIFSEIKFVDAELAKVAKKVAAGERLGAEDGLTILRTNDLVNLGKLADQEKRKKSGEFVYYSRNKHINYTNVCELECEFCRFSKNAEEPDAYNLSLKEIVARIDSRVREVHIVGGLHPDLPFDHYPEMVKMIRQERPEVCVKGFTAIEIAHFSKVSGFSIEEVLTKLKAAGLSSIPGGGAEVFAPRVRSILCPGKPSGKVWLDVHRTAHRLGIPSNATILYGHVETLEERVFHLTALRELQDQTKGFLCFVPLPFQEFKDHGYRSPDPCEDLKMIAFSRLYLDNFPHIKAYWVMLGLETTSMCLSYGADDIDGTVQEENIAHSAGAQTPQGIDETLIRLMVNQTGKIITERDNLYRAVKNA